MMRRLMAMMRRLTTNRGHGEPLSLPSFGAGIYINESSTLTVPAYVCCVRVLCESIGQMWWRVTDQATQQPVPAHPADRLLWREPNPEMDAAVFRELLMRHVLTWGNGYAEIVRDSSFRPVELWPLEPYRVEPRYDQTGTLYYQVLNDNGTSVDLAAADVLHFRGLGNALKGFSVIQMMARTLGLSVSQEQSMASQMEHGSRPSGVLVPYGDGSLSDKQAADLRDQWNAQNAGSANHGKVVLASHGMDFRQMSIPNSDAQLIESRQFSVLDVCRFMRVPPHLVYDLSRATFSNITHQSLEFLINSAGPWLVKLEQQADRKLIARHNRGRYMTKIDPRNLLRMDPETRTNYYRELRDLGALSPNEVREREGLPPIEGGDVYLVPANMISVAKAAEGPVEEPPPGPPADELFDEPIDDEGAEDGN